MTWGVDIRRASRERGFTLLELVVVLILMGIASAAIFPAIVSMNHTTSRTTALSSASGEVLTGARLLERDIRGAAGDRSMGNRTDLAANIKASVITALDSPQASLHDVLSATPTQLELNSELLSTVPGIERITWQLRQNVATCGDRDRALNRNWCVVRTVANSAGAVLTSEVVVRGRGAYPSTSSCYSGAVSAQRLFCYRVNENANYTWNGGWTPTMCTQTWRDLNFASFPGGPGITTRHNGFMAATRIYPVDRITTIGVTLPAGGGYGDSSERVLQTMEVTPRSRQGEAYQQAIMCGAR
jgi:prepilin-type N-terminal cleavage/methylation domain-containing protein